MKLYAIKNKKGHYLTETMDWLESLEFAMLFNDYEVAKCYCNEGCKIADILLNDISDIKVKKQTINSVADIVKDMGNLDKVPMVDVLSAMESIAKDLNSIDVEKIKTELNKFAIEEETSSVKILNVQWFNDVGMVTIDNGYEIKTYIKKVSGCSEKQDIQEIIQLGFKIYPQQLKQILKFYENEEPKEE